jgi:hypothetical protein
MTPHTDTLNCHEAPHAVRALDKHLGELFDAADCAAAKTRAAEDADYRTRAARDAIKGLGKSLTELEACALVTALANAIEASGWKHTDRAVSAVESLMDAHFALEN